MRHNSIRFENDIVIKSGDPDLMRVEVEKTRRAHEISCTTELFLVPRVIDYDEASGTAIFERLDISPMSRIVPWGEKRIRLASCLGASLAILHRKLTLPDEMRIELPEQFSYPHDEVFLHGDVSVDNICVGKYYPPIVILDWQMTPVHGGRSTYGTRYFDIMWFISNIITRPYTRFMFVNPAAPVVDSFIEGYFSVSELRYDPKKMYIYAKQFFDAEMPRITNDINKKSKGRARLLLPFCRGILTEFLISLERRITTAE